MLSGFPDVIKNGFIFFFFCISITLKNTFISAHSKMITERHGEGYDIPFCCKILMNTFNQ